MDSDSPTKTAPIHRDARLAVSELVDVTTGHRLTLTPSASPFVVGSDSTCDLPLGDPFVSSRHCRLEASESGRIRLRDLGSKNGVYVGGARVDSALIGPGARIRLGNSVLELRSPDADRGFSRLLGESPSLQRAVSLAERAASTDCSVLILGETGTGKELFARAIHETSDRRHGPFLAVNCGAIPTELVAAELFGHTRGAFTGAVGERQGVFSRADSGTLFLDELGELPAAHQPHLLRVLETGLVTPVGGGEHRVDVRVVAATNVLDVGTSSSALREDLYHRLATVVIEIPPLRERRADIPRLVQHFMSELAGRYGYRRISESTLETLCGLDWPGNIRELRQAIHRATALCCSELTLDALMPRRAERRESPAADPLTGDLLPVDRAIRDLMHQAYQRYGTIRRAAASLGMPKSTFADRAKRYGIVKPGAGHDRDTRW